jgi:hypothetical protein
MDVEMKADALSPGTMLERRCGTFRLHVESRFVRLRWLPFSFEGRINRSTFILQGSGYGVHCQLHACRRSPDSGLLTIANPQRRRIQRSDCDCGAGIAVPMFVRSNLL